MRTTRFSDVCGSLDELKRALREETDPDPAVLLELLEDVRYMLGRMDRRLAEYRQFEQQAEVLLAQIRSQGPSRLGEAMAVADGIEAALADRPRSAEETEQTCARAEQIREVANELEGKLRQSRTAAIALYRLYLGVRGRRDWSQEEGETTAPAGEGETDLAARLGPWLPPSPHRERILDWLARGRAHLHPPTADGQPPHVEFEDGGAMPLPQVRWSEAVENFHPAGTEPHPRGLQHRDR